MDLYNSELLCMFALYSSLETVFLCTCRETRGDASDCIQRPFHGTYVHTYVAVYSASCILHNCIYIIYIVHTLYTVYRIYYTWHSVFIILYNGIIIIVLS